MASIFRPSPEMNGSNVGDSGSYSPVTHSGVTVTTGIPHYTSTTGSPIHPTVEVNHVRANMAQRWVLAKDFMSYVDPSLSDLQIQLAIRRLMRQAYIKAQWPPYKATPAEIAQLTFVAVVFENLYLLFDNDCEEWETPMAKKVKRDTR